MFRIIMDLSHQDGDECYLSHCIKRQRKSQNRVPRVIIAHLDTKW
jgi:hypothetical protein